MQTTDAVHATNRTLSSEARRGLDTHRLLTALATLTCAAALAACGASGRPTAGGPTGGPLLAYARCMRGHGVANFPDPRATGGLVIPNDINPQSPAFRSAQAACGSLARPPGSQPMSSEDAKLRLLALARCMRARGVPNFPDPTNSPPPPSGGNAIGGDGSYLSLGTPRERQSPAYERAASACGGAIP